MRPCEILSCLAGGVLLVSHDQRLLSLVAKELWVADQGHVSQFDGEFADYKRIIASRLKAP
jgi:ATPase subunit of ABC transporter with duplicated ATPase domains